MKRWLIRIGILGSILSLLLFAGVFYLLGTESGTQFLVRQTVNLMDGSLTIAASKGKLIDRLELHDIHYKDSIGKAEVAHLLLDWKSSELLKRHFHILDFTVDDVSYTLFPGETEPVESTDVVLPELSLPLRISIEKFALQSFRFYASPDSEPITVHKAGLALSWDNNGIRLKNLQVNMDEASLFATGDLNPIGAYPLHLTTTVTTLRPDLPALTMEGSYTGDLEKLQVREEIRGDFIVDLDMTLLQLINDLSWQGDITITELRPAVFAPDVSGMVTGSIRTKGTLKQADVTTKLRIRDKDATELNWDATLIASANLDSLVFDIKQLSVEQPQKPARLDISGTADLEQQLDLSLHWQQLQWPLTGDADYSSTSGDATLKGTLDAFHVTMASVVAGQQVPTTDIHLSADGNSEQLKDLQLKLKLLDGEVSLNGDVAWTPAVSWSVSCEAQHINPGIHYPDWPGKIDLQLLTDGNIADDGVTTTVAIKTLTGNVRDLPISGTGNIHMRPGDIRIQDFRLASGNAVISASGTLSEQSDLKWTADIADFSDLLPGASGSLQAKGTVRDKMTKPRVMLDLSGSAIHYSDYKLEQINTKAALDLSWATPFELTLTAHNLQAGENLIKSISATGDGSKEKHRTNLDVSHELADLHLELSGGYNKDTWKGMLDTFDITSTDLGTWQLQKPSKISATATQASIDTLCLSKENSDLCLQGKWDTDNKTTAGDVQISKFPLSLLSPWFPDTLEELTGIFSAKAHASMQEKLKADVDIAITPGNIHYITDKTTGTLPHEGMKLTLKVLEDALDAQFHLSVDSNVIRGEMRSPNLLQTDIGGKAKLNGKLLVDAKNFDLIEALVPDVQNLEGLIGMNFTILGSVAEPAINGQGQISIANMLIPIAGLDLKDTTLDVQAISPEGEMELAGNASLDSSKKWPARITLKGDNFRLINLPEIKMFLSSDILFEKRADLMSLTGSATIPRAEILLRELSPGSKSPSPDMVIIQEQKAVDPKSPFHMLLKITLGEDVHFAGFGLNAFVEGQLTILSEPEEQMIGSGAFHIKQGSFRAYGQDLEIETGVISFPGGPLSQPGINLRATRTVGDVVAGIYAIGSAKKPRITTFSNPPMSESHVISYLLTGSAPNDSSGKGAKLSIGRQINNKLSVALGTDIKTGESEFITRYRLSRSIHIETTTGASSNAADIFYTIELENDDVKVPKLLP